jgi:hypothetical protein
LIDKKTGKAVYKTSQEFWEKQATSEIFQQIAQGKEVGHRIADFVDEQTTALLARHFSTKYQCNSKGEVLTRSMGDIWLECNGIYHPVNIKSGVTGSEGQPNMVALKKVLTALLLCQIDSYYLLMVKVDINGSISPKVYFVDMLDHLEFVTFDSGPGQIMLKAKAFFNAFADGFVSPKLTIEEKIDKLIELLEDGERRLVINRENRLRAIKTMVSNYYKSKSHIVTPETQKPLNLK